MRKEIIINLGLIWNKTCILLPTCYGNPITKEKREENKFHKTPSKWTYNFSIFNFILLHSYWNDNLEIWSSCSAIKSHSLKESGLYLPLSNYILTFCHLQIIYGWLVRGQSYFMRDHLRITERLSRSWLLPELCFFFVSFFYSIKEYCY